MSFITGRHRRRTPDKWIVGIRISKGTTFSQVWLHSSNGKNPTVNAFQNLAGLAFRPVCGDGRSSFRHGARFLAVDRMDDGKKRYMFGDRGRAGLHNLSNGDSMNAPV